MKIHLRGKGIHGCYPFRTACGIWKQDYTHEKNRRHVTCVRNGCRRAERLNKRKRGGEKI